MVGEEKHDLGRRQGMLKPHLKERRFKMSKKTGYGGAHL